ncbi:MAG: amino acid transporter [Rhodobacterales bacterium]|nr:MAG: amino acid transporter [Rhodobacterales bacterium]
MHSFIAGFSLGFSLILAIGAQNAFVLRQGLRRQHVLAVCSACALSDAALIALGVSSFGVVSQLMPRIAPLMIYGGAGFLIFYGGLALRSALTGNQSLQAAQTRPESLTKTLLICLTLTWLNPHVYLDTVILLGSVSLRYESAALFAGGAMLASFVFFFALGYGAKLLAPVFAKAWAWRMLDVIVALVMWGIAVSLVLGAAG